MTRVEEGIWAAAFSELPPHIAIGLSPINAYRHACWQVRLFRGQLEEPTDEEALSMHREMLGAAESERLSIQKEMVRGLIQFIEGRVDVVDSVQTRTTFGVPYGKSVTSQELRYIIRELRTMLGE